MTLKRNKRLFLILLILLTTALTLSSSIINTKAGPYVPEDHVDNKWHWEVDVGDQLYFEGEFILTNSSTGEVEMMFKDIWIFNITDIVNATVDLLGKNNVSLVLATQCYDNVSSGELEAYGPPSELALFGYNSTDPIKHRIRAGMNGMPFILPINGSNGLEVDVLAPIINETMYYPAGQMGAYSIFNNFSSNKDTNTIYFSNSTEGYFIEGSYYDNGTMNYGNAYFWVDMGEGPMLFNVSMTQVFDYDITDEVEWGVNIGDEFFYNSVENPDPVEEAYEWKIKITGFPELLLNKSNNGFISELMYMVFQGVSADRFIWNGTDYELVGNDLIGAANNFYPQYYDEAGEMVMPFLWPINVLREDIEFMWNLDTMGIWEGMNYDTIIINENGFWEFELSNSTGIDSVKLIIDKTTGVTQSFLNINPYGMMLYEIKAQTLVDWSVDIGDVIYYKTNQEKLYDMRATVFGIYTLYTNMSLVVQEYNYMGIPLVLPSDQPEYQFFSCPVAGIEYWDPDTESWAYAMENTIGVANIYWPVSPLIFEMGGPPMIVPEGTTSSELSDFFVMWSGVYDDITYNTGHVLLKNTTVNRELNFYFDEASGRMTMMYGWTKMPIPGEDWNYMSIYPKFCQALHSGTNAFTVSTNFPSGLTINIEVEVSGSNSAYISTFFPMNPVDEELPLGTAFAFFDQLMINYSAIVGNVTMTMIIPSSIDLSTVAFFFYAYNMSGTEEWDPAPPEFYVTSVIYNFAANTITIQMPTFPHGLISAMAYLDSEDLPPEIPGYDLFFLSLAIITVSAILVKKIHKKK